MPETIIISEAQKKRRNYQITKKLAMFLLNITMDQ